MIKCHRRSQNSEKNYSHITSIPLAIRRSEVIKEIRWQLVVDRESTTPCRQERKAPAMIERC